jgi:tetratricopeptide (TPR) repeat protein
LDIFRQQLPPQHPALALVQNNLATLLSKKGEFAAAVDLHSAVLESRKKTLKEHPYVAYSMTQLAIALTALGELDRAQPLLEEALAMENKIEASQSSDVADTLTALGVVRAEKGDWAGAETNQQTALEIRLKLLGENNPDVSDSLDAVSLLSAVRGDLADSTKSLRRALAITVKAQQANQLNALPVLDHLAWVVAQQGDQAQATEFRAKANVLRDSNGAYTETAWSEGWYLLAHLLCARKEFDKAEPVFTHTAQYFQGHLASSATLRKRSLSQMVQFYEAWNQMSSSPGLEVKIAEWKTKLAELQK